MVLIHHYRALFRDSKQACGDMYCRFYTYCRQRQFKPVRAAHILALKHILSPVFKFDIAYIVVVDDTYQSLPHVLPSKIVKRILEMMWAKIWLYLHTERKRESERKIVFLEMYCKMEFTCMNIYEGWQWVFECSTIAWSCRTNIS